MPQKLFETTVGAGVTIQNNLFSYSPHPDGHKFLVRVATETGEPTVNVITH